MNRSRILVQLRKRMVLPMLVLGPPLIGLAVYALAENRQIVPGFRGCSYVRNMAAQINCYAREIRSLVASEGLSHALAQVERRSARDEVLRGACHLAWHRIGEQDGVRAATRAQLRFPELPQGPFCAEGYTHGFFVTYLAASTLGPDGVREAERICGSLKESRPRVNCVHSFGHFSARTAQNIARATTSCERVASNMTGYPGAKIECLYGAFMEYAFADLRRNDAPLNNCTGVPRTALEGCYASLPARVALLRESQQQSADACSNDAPKGRLREICIESYARGISARECDLLLRKGERAFCRDRRKPAHTT